MTSESYPWFYAVNDRPVKFVELPSGEVDVLVYDFQTGEFIRDMSYLSRVFDHDKDVDKLDESAFNALVHDLRRARQPKQ